VEWGIVRSINNKYLFMTKYQIILGIIICAVFALLGSYLLLKQTSPSIILTHSVETMNHPVTPTPPPTVDINTNTQTVVTATSNAPIMPDQNLLDKARLLKLVNDCQVKSIEIFSGGGASTVGKITLKDGSLFDNPHSITFGEANGLPQLVKDKCPLKLFIQ
jgi:hypothetical protein